MEWRKRMALEALEAQPEPELRLHRRAHVNRLARLRRELVDVQDALRAIKGGKDSN